MTICQLNIFLIYRINIIIIIKIIGVIIKKIEHSLNHNYFIALFSQWYE